MYQQQQQQQQRMPSSTNARLNFSNMSNVAQNITGVRNLQQQSNIGNLRFHAKEAKNHASHFGNHVKGMANSLKHEAHGNFVEARNVYNQYASSPSDFSRKKENIVNSIRHAKKWVIGGGSNEYNRASSKEGTVLVKLPVTNTHVAHYVFNDVHPDRCVPLILEPRRNPFRFMAVVPNGTWAIATQFNKIVGTYEGGVHFLPPGRRIKYVVTKGHILFDYPIKSCPTLDNVIVKIDTLLVFKIVEPLKFAFELGPYKLRNLLVSFLQETIRSLARTVYYDKVYDLRGHNMQNMVRSLNNRFKEQYGVEAHSLTMTDIMIPGELHKSMEKTTSISAHERCRQKEHEFNIMKLLNGEKLENLKLDHKNERLEVDEEAKRFRNLISKEVEEIDALTTKRLFEVEAEEAHQVLTITRKVNKEVAELSEKKRNELLLAHAKANKKAAAIRANIEAHRIRVEAETRFNTSQNLAKAKEAVADAEEKCSSNMIDKRAYLQRLQQIKLLLQLPLNQQLVISGSSDYDQLAQLSAIKSIDHVQETPIQQAITPQIVSAVKKMPEPKQPVLIKKKMMTKR